ncbi:MAG: S8 family serine peptidase, partial [Weeksellaceae bacterium]|nr:S8 family serine peptidase [Weeksellaceae bacterium]
MLINEKNILFWEEIMRRKRLLFVLSLSLICMILIVLSDFTKQESKSIELVIIDSGISKEKEILLPDNWSIKYHSSKENKNNHADLVLQQILNNVVYEEDVNIIIHDIVVSNSNSISTEDLYNALSIAKELDSDIINLSLGVSIDDDSIKEIIEHINKNNTVVVAAAGNKFGMSAQYPARYKDVISVGSLNQKGDVSNFSAMKYVDEYRLGEYETYSGTSFSAPIVTAE